MPLVATSTASLSIDFQVVDDNGLAVAGLVAATLPAISWSLNTNTAATAISLSDLAAITSAYSSGGVKERSGGYYRLDVPNAALTAAGEVSIIGDATGKHVLCSKIIVSGIVTAGTVSDKVGYALSAAANQAVVQGVWGYTGTVYYVSTAGNDSNAGTTPAAAFLTVTKGLSVVSAGGAVFVGPGTFNEGGTAALNIPANVALVGMGIDVTVIVNATALGSVGAAVHPGSNSLTEGLTIQCDTSTGSSSAAWGYANVAGQTTFTNAVIRNCRLVGYSDCFYTVGSSTAQVCSFKAFDCIADSNFDTYRVNAVTVTAEFHNAKWSATNPTAQPVRIAGCVGTGAAGNVRFYGGEISVDATGNTNTLSYCVGQTSGSLVVDLFGTKLKSTGGAATWDVHAAAGTINAFGAIYDPAKVSGSGTLAIATQYPADVMQWLGVTPLALTAQQVQAAVATVPNSAGTTTLLSLLTAARAGYLDNLNVGGPVASHADFLALNQSASKHLLIATVGQYERPESGSTLYTVEARTFAAADGSAVNADTTPTLTATGQTSGSLAANLSAATSPATGVYRWTYTVAAAAAQEPIRFDVSATIAAATFTLSAYTQVVDEVSSTWTVTDRNMLTSTFNDAEAIKARTDHLPPVDAGQADGLMVNGINAGNVTFNEGWTIYGVGRAPLLLNYTGVFARPALSIVGGGSGDGISIVPGSGGAAIRAANIVGTLDTVATLTNLPTIPANWVTFAGIAGGALNGKGDWSTVAPDNAGVAAIKAKTDQLRFTTPNVVDASGGGGGGGSGDNIEVVINEIRAR